MGTPRDDVFFVAAMYHDNNPTQPQQLNSNSVFKVHKDDIGKWVVWGQDLTGFTDAQLTPNPRLHLSCMTKILGIRCRDWQYTANRCLRYPSRENAYGTIYMSYADFNGMQTDDKRSFTLAEGEIEVSIIRSS